jgi:hypothetical protein
MDRRGFEILVRRFAMAGRVVDNIRTVTMGRVVKLVRPPRSSTPSKGRPPLSFPIVKRERDGAENWRTIGLTSVRSMLNAR